MLKKCDFHGILLILLWVIVNYTYVVESIDTGSSSRRHSRIDGLLIGADLQGR